ncbi:hypothetical protein J2T15_003705 [Paenibacillus harenae]|uniref:Uncharacterized protein n=1 Tax=Paenibacillus harenae TaxID=306543 RepID=A0ABT9U6C9_PAEHA|nr:hypothetical protein [Paenibacillus harenae]
MRELLYYGKKFPTYWIKQVKMRAEICSCKHPNYCIRSLNKRNKQWNSLFGSTRNESASLRETLAQSNSGSLGLYFPVHDCHCFFLRLTNRHT